MGDNIQRINSMSINTSAVISFPTDGQISTWIMLETNSHSFVTLMYGESLQRELYHTDITNISEYNSLEIEVTREHTLRFDSDNSTTDSIKQEWLKRAQLIEALKCAGVYFAKGTAPCYLAMWLGDSYELYLLCANYEQNNCLRYCLVTDNEPWSREALRLRFCHHHRQAVGCAYDLILEFCSLWCAGRGLGVEIDTDYESDTDDNE